MSENTAVDYKNLEVRKVEEPDEEIMSLLESTILGSEGGMQYSMQNIGERIKDYGKGISFMGLYKRNRLAGVIGLCNRNTMNCGTAYNSTHLRYLSVRSPFRTTATTVKQEKRLSLAQESFKNRLLEVFSGPPDKTVKEAEPYIMYAYVESKNERSKNLIHQAGYEYIRSFLTVAFSRFNPRASAAVSRLDKADEHEMRSMLNDYYKNYCFYSDEFSFFNNGYYVLRKEGRIVAGACAIPTKYRIVNVPGVWGWIMMKILPVLPYYRRLFRPGEFRYLVLSSIYCSKGNEHLLPELFEGICAAEKHNTALTWLDDHSGLYEALRSNRKMGALNRILNAKPGLIYASFNNIPPERRDCFYDFPAYISGIDFT